MTRRAAAVRRQVLLAQAEPAARLVSVVATLVATLATATLSRRCLHPAHRPRGPLVAGRLSAAPLTRINAAARTAATVQRQLLATTATIAVVPRMTAPSRALAATATATATGRLLVMSHSSQSTSRHGRVPRTTVVLTTTRIGLVRPASTLGLAHQQRLLALAAALQATAAVAALRPAPALLAARESSAFLLLLPPSTRLPPPAPRSCRRSVQLRLPRPRSP